MAIKIYTYSNPYELESEDYWDSIRNCPHFCVSQTMVNGLKEVCGSFSINGNITTINNLINKFYENWESIDIKVRQMVEIDNVATKLKFSGEHSENILKALLNNTKSITNSIRLLSELDLDPSDFDTKNINNDQKYLVDIYKEIYSNEKSYFKFNRVNDERMIDNSIKLVLTDIAARTHSNVPDFSKIDFSTVVINGIHQFTPSILCAIEDISKYKNVVLLFNYQKQYSEVYNTWISIYSLFNAPIKFSSVDEFMPDPFLQSYDINMFADCVGKLINCDYKEKNDELNNIEVVEFENITEFANYVANKFDKALVKKEEDNNSKKSTLFYMDEQFYSASTKVNDILRAYFPNQFGERHFLDFPIGHFFVSSMNMWDSENDDIIISNFSDIKECLNSGIISESKNGLLINTFNNVLPFIEDLKTLKEVINKLTKLIKLLSSSSPEKKKVGYFNVKINDLNELVCGLKDLERIICSFFIDFHSGTDNFKKFYDRIKKFITSKVDDTKDFDDDMVAVMRELLDKLEHSDIPNTGSFITLKQTLSYYLSQDESLNSGAKWIVRGFEQIDGDVLKKMDDDKIFHFCCLSDKDICASRDERLPWPLDLSFFEYIQIPLDWKYQMFLKAKSEYHNFNRYALLYGLEFSRVNCKLSYVKTDNDKENDLYHIISMLGIKVKKYNSYEVSGFSPHLIYPKNIELDLDNYVGKLSQIEKLKISMCPYKFGSECVVNDHTIFRDRFLIHNYMRILIKNKVLYELQGQTYNPSIIRDKIMNVYDDLDSKFRICNQLEKAQLLAQCNNDVSSSYNIKNNKFKVLSVYDKEKMAKEEDFLLFNVDKDIDILKNEDIKSIFENMSFYYKRGRYCKFCASKDVCLESKD